MLKILSFNRTVYNKCVKQRWISNFTEISHTSTVFDGKIQSIIYIETRVLVWKIKKANLIFFFFENDEIYQIDVLNKLWMYVVSVSHSNDGTQLLNSKLLLWRRWLAQKGISIVQSSIEYYTNVIEQSFPYKFYMNTFLLRVQSE